MKIMNKVNLALVFVPISLASLTVMPKIDEKEIVKASRRPIVVHSSTVLQVKRGSYFQNQGFPKIREFYSFWANNFIFLPQMFLGITWWIKSCSVDSFVMTGLTLISMRGDTFISLSFLDQFWSVEFLSKSAKHFWRWKFTSIGLIWHPAKLIQVL